MVAPAEFVGHQFLCGCNAANAHVGPFVVIPPWPLRRDLLHLRNAVIDTKIEPFVPNRSVVVLDMGVLARLTGWI